MQISFSSIETFKNCPQKFKFQVIDRIKTPTNKEAFLGSLIHETLKWLYSQSPAFPTLEELLGYFKANWRPTENVFKDKSEDELYFTDGLRILREYYLKNSQSKLDIFNLEMPVRTPIEDKINNETHFITGKIDRIDKKENSYEIIDYKTAKKIPSEENINSNLQLATYYLGFLSKWPSLIQSPIDLSLYFLRHNEKFTIHHSPNEIENIKNQILNLINEIKVSNFEPKVSGLCDYCGYRKFCPMWKNLYEKAASAGEINKLIDEFASLSDHNRQNDKRMAEIKIEFNKYLDENKIERLFSENDYIITRKIQARYGYDEQRVKDILSPINKWNEVLSVDLKKLKTLLKLIPYHLKLEIEQARKKIKEFKTISISKIKKSA